MKVLLCFWYFYFKYVFLRFFLIKIIRKIYGIERNFIFYLLKIKFIELKSENIKFKLNLIFLKVLNILKFVFLCYDIYCKFF